MVTQRRLLKAAVAVATALAVFYAGWKFYAVNALAGSVIFLLYEVLLHSRRRQ